MSPEEQPLYLELPLRRAVVYAENSGVDWVEAMPMVLSRWPQLTPDAYWNLTVAEALAFLKEINSGAKAPDGS